MLIPVPVDAQLPDALFVERSSDGETETIAVSAWPPLLEPIPTQLSLWQRLLVWFGVAQ